MASSLPSDLIVGRETIIVYEDVICKVGLRIWAWKNYSLGLIRGALP